MDKSVRVGAGFPKLAASISPNWGLKSGQGTIRRSLLCLNEKRARHLAVSRPVNCVVQPSCFAA